MALTDSHIHTKYSFDSKSSLEEIVKEAEKKQLKAIALTDHVEFLNQPVKEVVHRITERNNEIDKLQKETNIKILKGLEISEPHLFKNEVNTLVNNLDIDFILGSVHHIFGLPIKKWTNYENIKNIYLLTILRMVENANIDSVAHLDYIKRNIKNGEFNQKMMDEVLKTIIERSIALEINTSGLRRCGEMFPSDQILSTYQNLGGKKVTIGSDAHTINELSQNLNEGEGKIKKLNLIEGYYKKRKFIPTKKTIR